MIPAQIKSDKETLIKLRKVAGDKPLTEFIREIADGSISLPSSIIENKLRGLHDMMLTLLHIHILEVPGLDEKIENSGISVWSAEMYDEILNDVTLLDNKEWLEAHMDKPADLTDIETWRKDYDEK
jgi:hypothetical protein